ncbi:MAG: hypothetical protein L3J20_07575 [Flavobacteriaceae bacterium]|nr:hypothetical protein [Flavobacteriaceae bacterium]
MKTLITITVSILIMTIFTQCSSAQQFDKEAPFTISKAYYQDWVGGRQGSSGILITFEIASEISKDIVLDSLFFNYKICKLEARSFNKKYSITGNFSKNTYVERNIIMDVDPRKEMANKVPDVTINFPFELSDNECIISYIIKEKRHYFKVTNLKKEKTIFYP